MVSLVFVGLQFSLVDHECMTFTAKIAAAQSQYIAITMLASYDKYYDTYWQNGGYKKCRIKFLRSGTSLCS